MLIGNFIKRSYTTFLFYIKSSKVFNLSSSGINLVPGGCPFKSFLFSFFFSSSIYYICASSLNFYKYFGTFPNSWFSSIYYCLIGGFFGGSGALEVFFSSVFIIISSLENDTYFRGFSSPLDILCFNESSIGSKLFYSNLFYYFGWIWK